MTAVSPPGDAPASESATRPAPTPEPVPAPAPAPAPANDPSYVTRLEPEQLASVVPPLDAWGDEALSLGVAEFLSGAVTSAYAALVTLDPDDDAAALKLAGLTSGFSFGASDPTAVAQGEGLSAADTLLLQFTDDAAASAFLTKQVADAERLLGVSPS